MPAALPYSATSRGELLRLSPDLTKVQARIPVGWAPSSIAITSTAVWVADSRGDLSNPDGRQDLVERIDPATDAVTAGVMVDDPQRLTAAGHAVWVTPGARAGSTRLLRISDAAAVAGMATVEGTVADVEVDGNDLWAAANDPAAGPDRVLRIDATSGAVIATIPLANQVGPLIVAPGAVLATVAGDSSGSDGVQAIDPGHECPQRCDSERQRSRRFGRAPHRPFDLGCRPGRCHRRRSSEPPTRGGPVDRRRFAGRECRGDRRRRRRDMDPDRNRRGSRDSGATRAVIGGLTSRRRRPEVM
jgi:DNA-binding beta-propeller fold protein YncE